MHGRSNVRIVSYILSRGCAVYHAHVMQALADINVTMYDMYARSYLYFEASCIIDDVNGSRVRPSLRPRTSRRLRMRDIHVIYADSNSADFVGFKSRLLLKWSQCKHSKKGTVRRDWNDVDNRNGRDVLEKRQRRETEGAVFETRGTKTGSMCCAMCFCACAA